MNVFISVDIEGICGVVARPHWDPEGADYRRACTWMTQEANAAIEGAIAAGAKRIVVKDAHNTATNINLEELHPAAELISGWGPLGSMVEGLDETFDALFLIGYHARAATVGGTLAHTWSRHVAELKLNGQVIGETGWAAAMAGHFGVPVALISGDDKLIAQAAEELPAGFRAVVTKTAWDYNGALMRPIETVRSELRQAARLALEQVESIRPLEVQLPATLTMKLHYGERLKACEAVPHVERIAPDVFQVLVADMIEAQKYFATLHRLARD